VERPAGLEQREVERGDGSQKPASVYSPWSARAGRVSRIIVPSYCV
jgi:hypothetical protein